MIGAGLDEPNDEGGGELEDDDEVATAQVSIDTGGEIDPAQVMMGAGGWNIIINKQTAFGHGGGEGIAKLAPDAFSFR